MARCGRIIERQSARGSGARHQKMIDDERDCEQVLTQVASMKAAARARRMLEAWALYCIGNPDRFSSPDVAARKMVDLVVKHSR